MELSCLLMYFLYLQNLQGITSSGKASVDSCHDEVCNKRSNDNSEGPPWQVPIELIIDWTLLTGEKSLATWNPTFQKGGFTGFFVPSVGPGFWRENQTLKHFTDSHNVSWTPPYCNILQYQRNSKWWSPPEDRYHRARWYRCVQRSESKSTPNTRQEKASPDDDTEHTKWRMSVSLFFLGNTRTWSAWGNLLLLLLQQLMLKEVGCQLHHLSEIPTWKFIMWLFSPLRKFARS